LTERTTSGHIQFFIGELNRPGRVFRQGIQLFLTKVSPVFRVFPRADNLAQFHNIPSQGLVI
jgi:hypothetical protein